MRETDLFLIDEIQLSQKSKLEHVINGGGVAITSIYICGHELWQKTSVDGDKSFIEWFKRNQKELEKTYLSI